MKINIKGHRFGKLTVIEEAPSIRVSEKSVRMWLCRCDCGQSKAIRQGELIIGHIKSCGCLSKEMLLKRTTHGRCRTGEYSSWRLMIQRCTNPKNTHYKDYGGRGIKVCARWLESFENFYEDMGERPQNFTIERINNDGHYEPSNCKWATRKEQYYNRVRKLV